MPELRDPDQQWSISAEAAVLGSMLLDATCIPNVLAIITKTDMLYSLPTRGVFDAIVAIHLRGITDIDAVLLRDELTKRKKLDEVGGVEFIKKILDSVPSSANAEYYAKIVREKYRYRLMLQILQQISEVPDAALDINEQIAMIQKLALSLEQEKETKAFTFEEATESVLALADKRHSITSGFRDVDRIIGGFFNNDLVVVAGRPGMGKSCLCCDIALHLAKHEKRVIIFTLEMSAESIIQRSVCAVASVDGFSWKGEVNAFEYNKAIETADEISNYPITIYETLETARQMYAIVSAAQRTGEVAAVVVDNIQLMRTDPYIPKEYERLTSISRNLKKITQVLKVPVLAISHLNREVDKRDKHRPRLSDLRGSGCVTAGSLITCEYEDTKIVSFYDNYKLDNVLSFSISKWRFCYQQPTKVYYAGDKRCLKIKTKSGKTLILSEETPIYTKNGWVKARDINKGQNIYVDKSVSSS